jgi:prepilin-type N-terminal cleavage/methylation domain-containing protein
MWAKQKQHLGFTIVELLIVIVVIGILAAITIVAYNGIQTRTRDNVRISDLKNLQKIVELYKAENGSYPLPTNGSLQWTGNCVTFGSVTNYISGVSSIVNSKLPLDPKWKNTDDKCYLYRSDGTDYMFLAWKVMETICGGDPSNACNSDQIRSMDRAVTPNELSIAVWSPGAANW